MISYKQGGPRWADKTIGNTQLTLKRVGCLITCVADLSTYFGDLFDPAIVCDRCKFTPDARLIWASAVFPSFEFERREYGFNDEGIFAALEDPDRAVILQVNDGAHWVVATGWSIWHNCYKIADPLYGDRATIKRYHSNITGAAYFRRNKHETLP